MPKKLINVSNFSGGLNKNTNSRDMIADEYQVRQTKDRLRAAPESDVVIEMNERAIGNTGQLFTH